MSKRTTKPTALHVFLRDAKRLLTTPAALIVAIALIFLPSLYAWVNVYGFWNPYDNTQNLRVCVVNEDAGADTELIGHIDLGAMVVEDLEDDDRLGWVFTSRDDAMAQLQAGEAYAAFIIPKDFSANIAALASGEPRKAQLEYYVNEKVGPVAPKIMDNGATSLDAAVNDAFVSQVSSTVVAAFEQAAGEVQAKVETATANSRAHVATALAALGDIDSTLAGLEGTSDDARGRTENARSALAGSHDSLTRLSNDFAHMADLLGAATQSAADISLHLGNALDQGTSLATLATSETHIAVSEAAAAITSAKGEVDSAVNSAQAIVNEHAQLIAQLREMEETLPDGEVKKAIGTVIGSLESANAEMQSSLEAMEALSADIGGTAASAEQAATIADDATRQAVDTATGYRNTLDTDVLPALSTSIAAIATASTGISASIAGQQALVDQADAVLKELETTLQQTSTALGQTRSILGDARGTLETIDTDLQALASADTLQDLIGIGIDPQRVADFMLSPTTVNTKELYTLNAYGSAMAPLFINLTLWIGVFMLMVIMRMEVDEEKLKGVSIPQRFLGRQMLLAVMAALQAVVCCVGCLALGVQTASVPLFILTAVITSLAYLAIQFSLSSTFQHLGKATCVILVFVQIPGATGLYPIEMTTDFFRTVYPLFPFTYGINGIRETVFGLYGNLWANNIAVLLGFMAAFTAFGAMARPLVANLNRLFAQQIEETDLINVEAVELPARRYKVSQLIDVLSNRDEYRQQMEIRARRFMRNYPRFKWGALISGIAVPLVATPILTATGIDKAIILTSWLLWLIAIICALVIVEYIRDSLQHRVSLGDLSGSEIRRIYFDSDSHRKSSSRNKADAREIPRGKHARHEGGEAL